MNAIRSARRRGDEPRRGSSLPMVNGISHCAVDANGVRAEWVEATVATGGQWTIIHLHGQGCSGDTLATERRWVAELAIDTKARVLSVACTSVSDGVAAYGWLLGEGLDLARTAFLGGPADADLLAAVQLLAKDVGLPLPDDGPGGTAIGASPRTP